MKESLLYNALLENISDDDRVNIERRYERIADDIINESIVLTEEEKYVKGDKYVDMFKKGVKDRLVNRLKTDANLQKTASEIGINPNYSESGEMDAMNNLVKGGNIKQEVTDNVKKVIELLRTVTSNNGSIDWRRLKDNSQSYGMNYSDVMRIKDFIDANDLRYLYDRSVSAKGKMEKFGIKIDSEGNFDDSEFNLNTLSDDHYKDWYDTRKDKIPEFLSRAMMKKSILDKYTQSTYGISVDCPNFSLGNAKVTEALMINFTSAFRCPAWNECLVKHACYARAGEVRHYNNVKPSNDRKHLMWEACQDDPEMLKMVYDLLKAYVVDWNKLSAFYKPKAKNRVKIADAVKMNFSEMDGDLIEAVKQCKRVSYIRLNENGDFINQHLLDKIDELAGDFKLIGVNTAAYSCKNLKFDKLKNIIINASRINMEGPTIQRYFYAVPVKMYEAFPDTYTSRSMSNSFDSIGKVPQPLFSYVNGKKMPNGNYYYKCPCSRNDFTLLDKNGKAMSKDSVNCYQCHLCYEQNDEALREKLQNGGKFIVFVKAHGSKANLLDSSRENEIVRTVGVPENYEFGLTDNGIGYSDELESESVKNKKPLVTENTLINSENEAFNEITKNAVYSMTQRFDSMSMQESKFKNILNRLDEARKNM